MTVWDAMEGEYPRTISLFRTSYSFVAQARSNVHNVLSRVWMSQYAPDTSSYIPLYVATDTLPDSLIKGTMHKYDPGTASFMDSLRHLLTHSLTHVRFVLVELLCGRQLRRQVLPVCYSASAIATNENRIGDEREGGGSRSASIRPD